MKNSIVYRIFALTALSLMPLFSARAFAQTSYRLTEINSGGVGLALNDSQGVTGQNRSDTAFLWDGTALRNLGTLGGLRSTGNAINAYGSVTGEADTAADETHAFRWDGDLTDLGTLGGANSVGLAINANGLVTGGSEVDYGGGGHHAFLWVPWAPTTMQDIGTLGGTFSEGRAVNDSAWVTGYSTLSGDATQHAFLWDGMTIQDLGTLGGSSSIGRAINSAGQVAGESTTGAGESHAFLWDEAGMHDLGSLGGTGGLKVSALNAQGQVTGNGWTLGGESHAFLWDGTTLRDLGTPGVSSRARAINAAGMITGDFSSVGGGDHAFVWDGTAMRNLNELIDDTDPLKPYVDLTDGRSINDQGLILANGCSTLHGCGPYLLTPVGGPTPGATIRVSVDSSGVQANISNYSPSISANGRVVGFNGSSTNLVAGDTNARYDVFVRDIEANITERVSVDSNGNQGNEDSGSVALSADGQIVAFMSYSTNLVPGDANGRGDIFVRDRQAGTTALVSVDSNGGQSDCQSGFGAVSISASGRFVAFTSCATNLVPGVANGPLQVYVRDRQTGTTECVSLDQNGAPGDSDSRDPSISADGRFVAFATYATNLVPADANANISDIVVHDRQTGLNQLASVNSDGVQSDASSELPSISADGSVVAYLSQSPSLVLGDTNSVQDVFIHDFQSTSTERMSVSSLGVQADSASWEPAISGNGRFVVFMSAATNLVANDASPTEDIYVHDRITGSTQRVSVDSNGARADGGSDWPAVDASGSVVAFQSGASNLVQGDTNGSSDIFVHRRSSAADVSPPGITPSITGVQGTGGWYKGDVSLTWSVTDPDSTISSSSGCEPAAVNTDTAGRALTCTATSAGGSSSKVVVIRRDATPPIATGTPPMPNLNGWHNTNVAVHFTGSDATSGIASCSADASLTAEGANQVSATGTCTDNAGNVSAPASATGINIDKTAPIVSAVRDPGAGPGGWNVVPVVISFTGNDALSGLDLASCTSPITFLADGAGQSATGSCLDLAGNSGTGLSSGISIDRTPPGAVASASPAPNANGWNNSDVTVSFSGTDSLTGSGIAGCAADAVLVGVGLQSASGTCSDVAGNVSPSATGSANIDRAAPTISFVKPTDGSGFVQGALAAASYSCADDRSGVQTCVGSAANGANIDTGSVGSHTFTINATDAADNGSTATVTYDVNAPDGTVPPSGGIVVDTSAPSGIPAQVTVPAGVLTQSTQVAIAVDTTPPTVSIPPGLVATGSYFVSVELNPTPAYPLPAPGLTIVVPLTAALQPGVQLNLYSVAQGSGQLVAMLDNSGQPILGTVDGSGLSATFMGVTHFSEVVALIPSPAIPIVTPIISGTQGTNGWYTSTVSLTWNITTTAAITSKTGCTPQTIAADTSSTGLTFNCAVTNAAGTATTSVVIKKDASAPTTRATATPGPNILGWRKSVVTVSFTGTDVQSGIASCSSSITLREGRNQSAAGQCRSGAGLTSNATASGINIDLTAPTVTITTPANGAAYARNSTLVAKFSCSDALSGLVGCLGTVANGTKVSTSTAGLKTFVVSGLDVAGNSTTKTVSYRIQ